MSGRNNKGFSEEFLRELVEIKDDEEFYKQLGLPVPSGLESEDEWDNGDDDADEVGLATENEPLPENILRNIIEQEKELNSASTSASTASEVSYFYFLLYTNCSPK